MRFDFDRERLAKIREDLTAEKIHAAQRVWNLFFAFCFLLGMSLLAGIVYVAYHFIAKWW